MKGDGRQGLAGSLGFFDAIVPGPGQQWIPKLPPEMFIFHPLTQPGRVWKDSFKSHVRRVAEGLDPTKMGFYFRPWYDVPYIFAEEHFKYLRSKVPRETLYLIPNPGVSFGKTEAYRVYMELLRQEIGSRSLLEFLISSTNIFGDAAKSCVLGLAYTRYAVAGGVRD